MGWWKCNEKGGIAWDNLPSGHPGETALINAIPGRDTTEDYYNGDQPADIMDRSIAKLASALKNKEKPDYDQCLELFLKNVIPPSLVVDREWLMQLVASTWKEIEGVYKECWDRPPYNEEKSYICKFCFGCLRGNDPDFWKFKTKD
jgi:hypothetical protein